MAAPKNGVLAEILNDLNKDSKSGSVQYLKDGDTTLKLVLPVGRDLKGFYERFTSIYKGKPNISYLIAAVIIEADEDGVADTTKVRYVRVTKSVLLEIVNLLTKKWKLFDTSGPTIVITRGKGKNSMTAYNVAALPDTFDSAGLPFPEEDINTAARGQEEMSAKLDAEQGEELK